MFYSVTRVMGELVTMEDPFGEITVTTTEFFDYDVQENDVAVFENEIFSLAKEETENRKKANYDRIQGLVNRE